MARSDDQADYAVRAAKVAPDEIPMVDFQPFLQGGEGGRRRTADAIAGACEEIGFFYLKNHGVPAEATAALHRESRAFFSQPLEARQRSAATLEWHRGWMDLSKVGLSERSREIESYQIKADHPWAPGAGLRERYLYAPNRWPDEMPGFRAAAERYFGHLSALAAQLRQAFALGLGLAADRFEDLYVKPMYQLTLLHYGAIPPDDAEAVNSTPHTDEGPFTLLWQDDAGGLEVKRRDGVWIAAAPVDGTFVVNVGDMLMWLSNGRYRSNLHKVRNTSGRERFSIPFFANPDAAATIAPLPELAARDGGARHPAVNAGDRMMQFAPKELRSS
jgi:isopenicillin N synthase-like dioxygenase